jgi:hypothetical protein
LACLGRKQKHKIKIITNGPVTHKSKIKFIPTKPLSDPLEPIKTKHVLIELKEKNPVMIISMNQKGNIHLRLLNNK